MHTKFTLSMMVMNNDVHSMPSHFFLKGIRSISPPISRWWSSREYLFQQVFGHSHGAHMIQEWLVENFYENNIPNLRPSSSPYLHPLDYCTQRWTSHDTYVSCDYHQKISEVWIEFDVNREHLIYEELNYGDSNTPCVHTKKYQSKRCIGCQSEHQKS